MYLKQKLKLRMSDECDELTKNALLQTILPTGQAELVREQRYISLQIFICYSNLASRHHQCM